MLDRAGKVGGIELDGLGSGHGVFGQRQVVKVDAFVDRGGRRRFRRLAVTVVDSSTVGGFMIGHILLKRLLIGHLVVLDGRGV
ncbi:MAG: hypothetical protein AAFP84_19400 [Actinomycetota bacterium]